MEKRSIVLEGAQGKKGLLERFNSHKTLFDRKVLRNVLELFDQVAADGDEAVVRATAQFDGVKLERGGLELSEDYVTSCMSGLSSSLRTAIEEAIVNVREVNEAMMPSTWMKEIRSGTIIGERFASLDSVGIWIPARKGPLLSTAIMLVTAAKVAGVKRIVVGMPPLPNGLGDSGTVAAAKLAGADQFVIGNGVAVIAALAQGTETIPEVDGIYGPGPGGIAAAMSVAMTYGKRSVLGLGPTESMIVADDGADPLRLAYDLINEAEHGPDSSAILITTSRQLAYSVEEQLWRRIDEVEEKRRDILKQVFSAQGKGVIVVVEDVEAAVELINWIAPEHLMIVAAKEQEQSILNGVRHAGEILLGEYTPFSAGNYAIGITAVLPTNQFAKAFSGVTCKDMVKCSTIGKLSQEALQRLYPTIQAMSDYEGLPCHGKAARIRM